VCRRCSQRVGSAFKGTWELRTRASFACFSRQHALHLHRTRVHPVDGVGADLHVPRTARLGPVRARMRAASCPRRACIDSRALPTALAGCRRARRSGSPRGRRRSARPCSRTAISCSCACGTASAGRPRPSSRLRPPRRRRRQALWRRTWPRFGRSSARWSACTPRRSGPRRWPSRRSFRSSSTSPPPGAAALRS
jgi:hypothetical protein